ncbi:endoribonuclease LACTB2 isoform X2 [Oratosquilla oratoria]|uniref:endoribonuclease LACTB2 isoform X2 n=1 Tax=Oratosquilla oratoria TaxID=337810 RepID=UPI003F760D89
MTAHIPKITQISPRIIRILGCNPGPMTLQGTNTYVIGTGKRRLLLDTGEEDNKEYLESLKTVLEDHKVTIGDIVISHWHHDHIGGLPGVSSLVGSTEAWKMPRLDELDHPSSGIALQTLNDKKEFHVDGATLKVHYTPGHTTDHVVLELLEENAIFSGDCILGEGTAVFEDLYTYMTSLNAIVDLNPNVIYPGHGPIIENPLPKLQYYIAHRNQREAQILETLQTSKEALTPMELVKIIYKETPEHLHRAAASNVSHHLEKLLKDGLVKNEGNKWSFLEKNKL